MCCSHQNRGWNVASLGVASPAKFSEVIGKAGLEWDGVNLLIELEGKPTRYSDWGKDEDWVSKLRQLIEKIHA